MSFFISLFSLNQEVVFCQESMELQPEEFVLFQILESSKLVGGNEQGGH